MKFCLLICVLCFFAIYVEAKPAQILLFRHAEKSEEKKSNTLSLKGKERAGALAPYFLGTEEYMRFGPFAAIYATEKSEKDPSNRTQETLMPLSRLSKMEILHPFTNSDFEKLAQEIINNPSYNGKTVLICWSHTFIPQFAHALGVTPEPSRWHWNDYDQVWMIRYPESGGVNFHIIQQALMFGDAPINIKTMP